MMQRKTKIVATLGPASNEKRKIKRLLEVGVNVFRLNFSHGDADTHIETARLIREIAVELQLPVGILCDLQGPKIRIGRFADGEVTLKNGDVFILDGGCKLGDEKRVGFDYEELPTVIKEGATLMLDDGRIILEVNRVSGNQIYCLVVSGGVLSNNKGINLKGGGLAVRALTHKDVEDIQVAAEIAADFIAVSFVKTAQDVDQTRAEIEKAGGTASVVAKIERAEAVENLEAIIDAADAIMVARGDLGVEVGDAAIPGLQKRMIKLARAKNKLAITATQMLESMINNSIPTRAEVSDVANAVLDSTDAVMLSAETAVGHYPIESVQAMDRVCIEAEKEYHSTHHIERRAHHHKFADEAMAAAAVFTAKHYDVKAIVALTTSGNSAQWLSRADCNVPIYALSHNRTARRKLTLHRNVFPKIISDVQTREQAFAEVKEVLLEAEAVSPGEEILITFGEPFGNSGGTNTLKLIKIED